MYPYPYPYPRTKKKVAQEESVDKTFQTEEEKKDEEEGEGAELFPPRGACPSMGPRYMIIIARGCRLLLPHFFYSEIGTVR